MPTAERLERIGQTVAYQRDLEAVFRFLASPPSPLQARLAEAADWLTDVRRNAEQLQSLVADEARREVQP